MKYIRWFSELGAVDVGWGGGKNASLGEMYSSLSSEGMCVPNGFAVTAQAYRHVLDQADAWPRLHKALDGLDARNVEDLAQWAQIRRPFHAHLHLRLNVASTSCELLFSPAVAMHPA